MSIDRIQKTSLSGEWAGQHGAVRSVERTPERGDVQWFSAAVQPTERAADSNVAERIVGQLAGSSEHLQQLSDKADRALRKASKSNDPQDVIQASRSLSSFYLESMLTTKLISKGTQAIEKLTNLQ
ncbi:EscI/YscI/HrpB family type III secretion system inner rod protein [Billgrantia tianxiuensis]|jgi:type III secretion system YscI/HrpB-like protein|uniref:EscI/YscI/HrpB family type III secretion system inner rod protein n=1 Tax=Billgrantia tianxiuensis TaxID=2497861 RepID=A0A6I6SMR3_9GAMM|nr:MULTISPECIES: type III secretion system inner rod subunit SctI [Halomonas]MCE8032133.1 type III secretion system inner rod subunit SctI [Halomonas sp. MCCC 1A11057]QHC49836.1 EscI/YscI/HrpB family type III secretion system inner rod protein [Halomonas tianxiuensis]